MRLVALLAAALAAGCSPEPLRPFPVGFAGPLSPRVAAEASRLGLAVADLPPSAAVVEQAWAEGAQATADWRTLRLLALQAAARGAGGVFFRLPPAPEGRDLLDYPEEWQAVVRALREASAMRPVLESGVEVPAPLAVPEGLTCRSWTYHGRAYILLVNASGTDAPLDPDALAPWRALFEARSDARQVLRPCGAKLCLSAGRALWLEGRLL